MQEEYINDNKTNKGTNNINKNYVFEDRKIIESFTFEELLKEEDIEKLKYIL